MILNGSKIFLLAQLLKEEELLIKLEKVQVLLAPLVLLATICMIGLLELDKENGYQWVFHQMVAMESQKV